MKSGGPLTRLVRLGRQLSPVAAYWTALVRVCLGVFFCISGGTKLFSAAAWQEMVRTLTASGLPYPEANAYFVSSVEFVGGGLLTVGLMTPLCAILLGGDMLVAILTNRLQSVEGANVLAWVDNFLYLPEVLYALILGWLLFAGPGTPSADAILAPEDEHLD